MIRKTEPFRGALLGYRDGELVGFAVDAAGNPLGHIAREWQGRGWSVHVTTAQDARDTFERVKGVRLAEGHDYDCTEPPF